MAAWVWALIAIAALVVVGVVVWKALAQRRSAKLRERFGPEYERVAERSDSRRDAEAELEAREERHSQFDVRPLSSAARERYVENWRVVQAQFVDDPRAAITSADALIQSVMADRGYPVEDFDQRADDISVDHPQVVEHYRIGHELAHAAADDDSSTENLRQAMRHYRALFDELVEPAADQPLAADTDGAAPARPTDTATAR